MNKIWIALFILLSLVFLIRYFIIGQAVYGDGIFYWAYTRSIYFDGDLNFYNELGHKYSPENNNTLNEEITETYKHGEPTANNAAANRYPPGAPISWLPFFFFADVIQHLPQALGREVPSIGYSDTYQIAVGLGNILFIITGLIFLNRFLRNFFPKYVSLITTAFMLFATNLFYYGSLDVINSHPLSFMLSSVYFFVWGKSRNNRTLKQWLFLGILLGYMGATRTQDLVLGIIPGLELVISILNRKRHVFKLVKLSIIFICGILIGYLLQLLAWFKVYGALKSPYIDGNSFQFLSPHILEVLFNTKTGLLYYTPVFLLGFFGLFFFRKKEKNAAIILISAILFQVYIISSWGAWHQGESFGIRMLISSIPAFAVGVGYLFTLLLIKHQKHKLFATIALLILYNLCMIAFFQLYIQGSSYISGENTQQIIMNKFKDFL